MAKSHIELCQTLLENTKMLPELPEGSVTVERHGSIVHVTLTGWITERLTNRVQAELEAELLKTSQSSVLYDGLHMQDPSLTLVLLMQSFNERLSQRISKSAIVVPGYRLAFLARLAFGQDAAKYSVFYNNREEAMAWLGAVAANHF